MRRLTQGFVPYLLAFLLLSLVKIIYAKLPDFLHLDKQDNKEPIEYVLKGLDGVKGRVKKNIHARLSVLEASYSKTPTNKEILNFIQAAPNQVLQAMQPYGFYKPQINVSRLVDSVRIDIKSGPLMKVTTLSIEITGEGANEAFFKKSLQDFPLKVGDPLLIEKYLKGKQALLDTASSNGYIKAKMTEARVSVDLEKYTSDIVIRLNTEKRFYFGAVSFSKTPYNEDYLARYIPFHKGAPFSPEQLTSFHEALSGSDQFKQVTILPEYNNVQNQYVPVFVKLAPAPSQSYTFGLGYGTDTGPRGTAGWNLLEVTPSGDKFKALIQVSQLQNSVQAQYIIPGLNPTKQEYAMTASVYNLVYPGSKSNEAQLSGSYRDNTGSWKKAYSINALFADYTIEKDPRQKTFVLYPSANWVYRQVDNPIFSKSGYSLSFTTQASSESFGSKVSFAQAEVIGKWAHTFEPLHARLYTHGDFGITSVDDINNLPPSLQFYTGGSQSVRGYSYQSLGPGKMLAMGSVEWQQEVMKKKYWTFFYDAGNAFNNAPVDLQKSAGTGVLWVTPVGPLHLSFAYAFDQNPADRGPWHVVFSMGPDL